MSLTEEVGGTPQQLGKYRLEQKLGEGGFGAVYKAYDPDLQVYRAVKVAAIQGENADEILKEARLQAQMTHTNLVQVHSVEQLDGRWAIVMEYLEGGSLRDRLLEAKPMPPDTALRYTAEIASGMKAAHAKNVLHHDIKPENILFDSNDVPKVADFGIARIIRETNRDMSRVLGTAAYMAPEQLEGRADLRSDVWSLGVMLYEMLSGKPCFSGNSVGEVVKNIVMGRPAPLRSLNRAVSRDLEKIVMHMIEKDPKARAQSMGEVISAIEAYRKGARVRKSKPWRAMITFLAALACMVTGYCYGVRTGILEGYPALTGKSRTADIPAGKVPAEVQALSPEKQMDRADLAINQKEYPLAYSILSNAIGKAKDKETRAQALLSRGLLLSENMNQAEYALKDFQRIVEEAPGGVYDANAHYYAGWIFYEKKHNLRQAVSHLTTVLVRYPDSPMAQTAQFLATEAAGKLEKEGAYTGLAVKSLPGGFLPNNIVSLVLSTTSFFILVSALLWLAFSSMRHPVQTEGVSSMGLKGTMKTAPRIIILVMVIVLCQMASFFISSYKSRADYSAMVSELKAGGVIIQTKNK